MLLFYFDTLLTIELSNVTPIMKYQINGVVGIRTLETISGLSAFKADAFNRSATTPNIQAWSELLIHI